MGKYGLLCSVKIFEKMQTILVTVTLGLITTIFVVYAKSMDYEIQAFSPQVDCDMNFK
jgi:hypothetical protein